MSTKAFLFAVLFATCYAVVNGQSIPTFHYTLHVTDPASGQYAVHALIQHFDADTLRLKLPNWTPGYYQMMDYADDVSEFTVLSKNAELVNATDNEWVIVKQGPADIEIAYKVQTKTKFVARSYVDSTHAYIIGANSFMYAEGYLSAPALVMIEKPEVWQVATGLEPKDNFYSASDFDILYDCPILLGSLEELPAFQIAGVQHRFVGWQLGQFDQAAFISDLEKIVQGSIDVVGHIPYTAYTFIAIGPGMGGIEHLNNTTVSFDGNNLDQPESVKKMYAFLAHEHFHNYNVKRIRPLELGPFDYENGSRTHLLWFSEGVTVYYEYLILLRAGIISRDEFLEEMSNQIQTLQRNTGRLVQTLRQASYNTWEDGPFGRPGNTISIYNKGAVIGMLLDMAIRRHTQNQKSLDDVVRYLYQEYYLKLNRGFTETEFQTVCQTIAADSLISFFGLIDSTTEIDYSSYLSYFGLELSSQNQQLFISKTNSEDSSQLHNLDCWLDPQKP